MTPKDKILITILKAAMPEVTDLSVENVNTLFDTDQTGKLYDAKYEFRSGEVETKIKVDWDRNYESQSVAAKMFDGSWVGWTYWYGGGKHGNPESIDWLSEAYELSCQEEQKLVTVQTFTKLS